MDYENRILVQLADPATRSGIFDEISLEQILSAAYDTEAISVESPFNAIFDNFQLGFSIPRLGTLEGNWSQVGTNIQTEARFQFSGINHQGSERLAAFWQGAIVARTVLATGIINDAQADWPSLSSIDSDIIADLGNLPADSDDLEQARRDQLIAFLQTNLDQPDVLTAESLDAWLGRMRVGSVGELITQSNSTKAIGTMQVAISTPVAVQPSPKRFPIAAAIMIRDVGFSLADLLSESKSALERLRKMGMERSTDASLPIKNPLVVVWILPESEFDDGDWTGATGGNTAARRAARRNAAGQWLAREGIGLVTTPG